MKTYLNDEKTPVDPWLLYDNLWGLKYLCDIFVFNMIATDFCNILEYRIFLDAIQNQYIGKVRVFQEGHKNWRNLHHWFDIM